VYCAVAKRLAGKGYAVFLVHYLDGLAAEDRKSIGELVKRGLSGTATAEEMRRVHDHFEIWMDCVRDALVHVRNQPRVDSERVGVVGVSLGGFVGLACAGRKDLKLAAAIACFGGLPRAMQERLQSLPPTLVIHGDKDDVVPVEEAHALRKLAADKKLPIEVTIYPGVGHVFRTAEGKFDLASLKDADQRITEHLHIHLTGEGTQAKSHKSIPQAGRAASCGRPPRITGYRRVLRITRRENQTGQRELHARFALPREVARQTLTRARSAR